jgi:hypothetical protein
MHDLAKLRQGIADARQEVRYLVAAGLRPGWVPAYAELIREAERAARAEVKARQQHLNWVLTQTKPGA